MICVDSSSCNEYVFGLNLAFTVYATVQALYFATKTRQAASRTVRERNI